MKFSKFSAIISFVLLSFSTISIIGVFCLYKWTFNWDARISKMEQIVQISPSMQRDSLLRALELKDIKEEIYIRQLDKTSDWVLGFVTLLFGIAVVVQIATFEARIQSVSDKYNEQKTESANHVAQVEKRFKKMQADILRTLVQSMMLQSEYSTERGLNRGSLQKNAEIIDRAIEIKEIDEDFKEFNSFVLKTLSNCLLNIQSILGKMDSGNEFITIFFTSDEALSYKEYFNKIYEKVDNASREKIKEIFAKLDEGIKKEAELNRRQNNS